MAVMRTNAQGQAGSESVPFKDARTSVRAGVDAILKIGKPKTLLAAGDIAPDFELRREAGTTVSLYGSLRRGPVVLVFFRGTWCPHCRAELMSLEATYDEFRSRGASILAVSSDATSEQRALSGELGLSFPLLSDIDKEVAGEFGLRWPISLDMATKHPSLVPELLEGSKTAVLPVPGRFIVGADGVIAYADVDPDYTRRATPEEFYPTLDNLIAKEHSRLR
jgi:peroxiredoxin